MTPEVFPGDSPNTTEAAIVFRVKFLLSLSCSLGRPLVLFQKSEEGDKLLLLGWIPLFGLRTEWIKPIKLKLGWICENKAHKTLFFLILFT